MVFAVFFAFFSEVFFIFCEDVWGFSWNNLSRFSVFLVLILSVTRTIHIVHPFEKISRKVLLLVIVIFFVVQIVLGSTIFWDRWDDPNPRWFYYNVTYVDCTGVFANEGDTHTVAWHIFVIMQMISYAGPIVPITLSCCVSIHARRASSEVSALLTNKNTIRELSDTQRTSIMSLASEQVQQRIRHQFEHANYTIILFTIVYIIFNIPFCIAVVLDFIDNETGYKCNFFGFDGPKYYVMNFLYQHLLSMNSAINPVLYYIRMDDFRRQIMITF